MVNGGDDHVFLNSDKVPVSEKPESRLPSTSSEEDFIQYDASELRNSVTGNGHVDRNNSKLPPDVGGDAQLASDMRAPGGETARPNNFSSREVGNADGSSLLGAKQSPVTQVMVKSDGPDPFRIPSSIFERSKSTTPVEWSVASNESLFSIHGGNSSFSRDHAFLIGRSGELADLPLSPPDAYPPIRTVLEDPHAQNLDMGHDPGQDITTEAANAEAMKHVLRAAADGHVDKEKLPIGGNPQSGSFSRQSDGSSQSFAFPILTERRSGSVKVEPKQQPQGQMQQQPQAEDQKEAPEVPLDATQRSWFSCCSCSPCF